MRRLSACSRAAAGLLVPILAALALAAPAGSATIPLGKARQIAAKRLFGYVWSFSYVTDYELTTCTRTSGGGVACGYRIAFYASEPCAGTILVGYRGRAVTSRFTGDVCNGPTAPVPAAPAAPATTATTTDPAATAATTTSVDTTAATTTADSTPAAPTTTATTTTTTTTAATTPVDTPAYAGVGAVHTLDSVEGGVVKLDDGSHWQVSGSVVDWVFDDVIDVAYASGVYTLTDNASGSSVTAVYLG